jgi:hypothetical protein
VSITQGDGQADGADLSGFSVGGNLSVTVGDGDQDLVVIDDSTVTGNTSLHLGNGSSDKVDIGTDGSGSSVTFQKDVSIKFGKGGGATLNIGSMDGSDDNDGSSGTSDSVSFNGHADFSAGGSANIYNVGDMVFFQLGQPNRHNI